MYFTEAEQENRIQGGQAGCTDTMFHLPRTISYAATNTIELN